MRSRVSTPAPEKSWLTSQTPAFRLMIATSWLAPGEWREGQEQAILDALSDSPDEAEYLELVTSRHRTPAVSLDALRRIPGLAPASIRRALQPEAAATRRQADRLLGWLTTALEAFEREGISVMPLKGPLLSLDLYGDPVMRQVHDLDIACPPEDLERGIACLRRLGFRLKDDSVLELTPRLWRRAIRHEYHFGLVHPRDEAQLELHWREPGETPGATAERWRRSVPARWQGFSYRRMDPVDEILYLCRHGSRHVWFRAKWIADLAVLFAAGRIDYAACLERASGQGLAPVLRAALGLLRELYGLPRPACGGRPHSRIPEFLRSGPRRALTAAFSGPKKMTARESVLYHLRMFRLASPAARRDALLGLAWQRDDYRLIRLPDRLFWLYPLLRPALMVWRRSGVAAPSALPRRVQQPAQGMYSLCGWRVESDIPLPELASWPSGIAQGRRLLIRTGPVPEGSSEHFHITPQQDAVLDVPGQFRMLVQAGGPGREDRATLQLAPEADPLLVRSFLYGSVLAVLCFRRGLLPIHGSSVRIGPGAVIFSGASGAGKSTLAAALAQRGLRLLSDDVCALDLSDPGRPLLWPALSRVKLLADAIDALQLGSTAVSTRAARGEKGHFTMASPAAGASDPRPIPVTAIYALDGADSPTPARHRLRGRDRFAFLDLQIYRAWMGRRLDLHRQLFDQVAALAQAVPVYSLHGPQRLSRIGETAAWLEATHSAEAVGSELVCRRTE